MLLFPVVGLLALDLARQSTGANAAQVKYGVSGRGVAIAILDRGIDWQHPDFRNPDGTTRIKWMLDMSGQNYCSAGNPAPVEYTEAQINAALQGRSPLTERDAVGHGTLTAGIAAGNGRASNGKYAGIAPEADLVVVKMTSDGVPAHGSQPAEPVFVACTTDALAWLDEKIKLLGEPTVGLINSGVQLWGPVDGTSAISRAIDTVFGQSRPGRIYIEASGDEAGIPNHAGGFYNSAANTVVRLIKNTSDSQQMALWYTGSQPVQITVTVGAATVGPVATNTYTKSADGSIQVAQYDPGQEFYPATSTSGDRLVWFQVDGHNGEAGAVTIRGISGSGSFDLYSWWLGAISFTDHLVPGRLTDYASTRSAIVTGAHVNRASYTDIDGITRTVISQGSPGQLWTGSSGGPTRDGRRGVDLTTPGQNIFAPVAANSYWATFRSDQPNDGGGYYSLQGATSGASPITLGAVALLLQMKPDLTSDQVRALLHASAVADANTGAIPNNDWGYGKLSIVGAIDNLCAQNQSTDALLAAKCNGLLTRAPALSLSSSQIQFAAAAGSSPASQAITIANSGGGAFGWTAASDSPWLTVSPASGTTPTPLTVTAIPGSLAPAVYQGKITFTTTGNATVPIALSVTLTLTQPAPAIQTSGGVVNGASFLVGMVGGSWVTILGSNLSTSTRIWADADFQGISLPTNLSGVQVKINDQLAAIYYISPGQLNVQAPSPLSGDVTVQVILNGIAGNTVTATAVPNAPALFSYQGGANKYPAAVFLNSAVWGDPGVVLGTQLARPGDNVLLYATGLESSPSGTVISSPLDSAQPVTITIGSANANVTYAGLVAVGEFQINIVVPNLPPGNYPITINIAGQTSAAHVIAPIGP
ncbi:MAG: S8 family serine peptidase [Bryobacteraceae bacterium]